MRLSAISLYLWGIRLITRSMSFVDFIEENGKLLIGSHALTQRAEHNGGPDIKNGSDVAALCYDLSMDEET